MQQFKDAFEKLAKSNKSINNTLKDIEKQDDILMLFGQLPFLDDEIANILLKQYFNNSNDLISKFKLHSYLTRINNDFWKVRKDLKKINDTNYEYKKIYKIIEKYINNQKDLSNSKALKYMLIYKKISLFIEDEAKKTTNEFVDILRETKDNLNLLKFFDKQLDDFLTISKDKNSEAIREAYFIKAKYLRRIKKYDIAKKYFEEVIKFPIQDDILAETYQLYGHILYKEFYDINRAKEYLEKSLNILDNNSYLKAKSYSILGNIYKKDKKYNEAINCFEKSLKIGNQLNNKSHIAQVIHDIGIMYRLIDAQKYFNQAKKHFTDSIKILKLINDKQGQAQVLQDLGILYKLQNKFEKSKEYFEKSLKLKIEVNDKRGEAQVLQEIGIIFNILKNNFEKSKEYFEKSLKIEKQINNKFGEAQVLHNLGKIYLYLQNDKKKAKEYFEKSLKIGKDINNKKHQEIVKKSLKKLKLK